MENSELIKWRYKTKIVLARRKSQQEMQISPYQNEESPAERAFERTPDLDKEADYFVQMTKKEAGLLHEVWLQKK